MTQTPRTFRRGRALALLAALLLAAGCATPQTDHLLAGGSGAPAARARLLDVPFFPQEDFYCGPAALAMVLDWAGDSVTPGELVPRAFTPGREGTLQTEILGDARRRGRLAYPVRNLANLLKEIEAGHPVLVLQNLGLSWYPQWHYAVAVGYDLAHRTIVLHSGRERMHEIGLELFERTWARGGYWAVVVLPPGELPRTARETPLIEAVTGLERTRHWKAAAETYEAALRRWPKSRGALLGLGNARYALGDLAGAERALRRGVRAHPDNPALLNNLAHVLARRGQREEAIAIARKAVSLGGPLRPVAEETLRSLTSQQKTPSEKNGRPSSKRGGGNP